MEEGAGEVAGRHEPAADGARANRVQPVGPPLRGRAGGVDGVRGDVKGGACRGRSIAADAAEAEVFHPTIFRAFHPARNAIAGAIAFIA